MDVMDALRGISVPYVEFRRVSVFLVHAIEVEPISGLWLLQKAKLNFDLVM
jgi:hypothetical protein